jgi:hypothetical protein
MPRQLLLPLVENLPPFASPSLLDFLFQFLFSLPRRILLGQDSNPPEPVVRLILEHVLDRIIDQAEASAAASPEIGLEPETAHERGIGFVLFGHGLLYDLVRGAGVRW